MAGTAREVAEEPIPGPGPQRSQMVGQLHSTDGRSHFLVKGRQAARGVLTGVGDCRALARCRQAITSSSESYGNLA